MTRKRRYPVLCPLYSVLRPLSSVICNLYSILRPPPLPLLPHLLPVEHLEGVFGGSFDPFIDHHRADLFPPSIMLGGEFDDDLGVLGGDIGGLALVRVKIKELPGWLDGC
jgi:hypothetical protein